ncbi:MAG: cytochrome P450 [Nocardioides sp.]
MRPPRAVRTRVRWGLEHGVPRTVFRRQARRGEIFSRLTFEPELHEDPTPAWAQVRARGPWTQGEFGAWSAHHAVGSAILRSEQFGVPLGDGTGNPRVDRLLHAMRDPWSIGPIDPPSLLALDPPDHTRLRRLVSRAFTVRRVTGLEPLIAATAERLLDRMESIPGRRGDLVSLYAAQLPVAVIADLLAVPERDRSRILDWGNGAALLLDAGLTWRDFQRAMRSLRELHQWMGEHLLRLAAAPGDDLLSQAIVASASAPEHERASDDELRMLGMLVLGAGFETTVNLLGNAVVLLDRHPAEREQLSADPDLWRNAVEEVLRFDSPVQFTARRAVHDVRLASLPGLGDLARLPEVVPRGTMVITMNGAMNRDPAVFEDPDRFYVDRANAAEHLAFSAGAHFCLGAGLARAEGALGLRLLYDRFPDLRVAGAPTRRTTRVLRGYERIPVVW